MRLPALALIVAAAAFPAAAQTSFDILHAENRLAAEQELARQRALAVEREAFAAQSRMRAGSILATLRAARLTADADPLRPAPLDGQISADAETIARLQAEALARSNARILAIKPASED